MRNKMENLDSSFCETEYEKICRTCCLPSATNKSVFNCEFDSVSLIDMLKDGASVEISLDDKLPKTVCETCISKIVSIYNFKLQCQEAQQKLLNIYCQFLENKILKDKIKENSKKETFSFYSNDSNSPSPNNEEEEKNSASTNGCKHCGSRYASKASLKNHIWLKHTVRKYSCEICQRTFAQEVTCLKHQLRHGLHCRICTKRFNTTEEVDEHLKTHKENPIDEKSTPNDSRNASTIKVVQKITKKSKNFKCKYCDLSYLSYQSRRTHMWKKHTERKFSCEQCGKMFAVVGHLLNHQMVHGLVCNICYKKFNTPEEVEAHIKEHPSKDKLACYICGKVKKSKGSLYMHIRSHTDERPFLCTFCGKSFKNGSTLRIHSEQHQGLKRYSCKLCNTKFTYEISLKAHQVVHTRERKYVCSYCNKAFLRVSNLNCHVRQVHANIRKHACAVCPKTFKDSSSLKIHTSIHTGQKYPCKYCDKAFTRPQSLKIHVRLHTGEKPYECNTCGKRFNQLHCLNSHLKSHKVVTTEVCQEVN